MPDFVVSTASSVIAHVTTNGTVVDVCNKITHVFLCIKLYVKLDTYISYYWRIHPKFLVASAHSINEAM